MSAIYIFLLVLLTLSSQAQKRPISLHPENGHYFLFRGQPTILLTSAEHYGAVLNLDFDYIPYLKELQSKDLNYTRIFVGSYVELPGAFKIMHNTLAPLPGRVIVPWARSATSGYHHGGNKFDLDKWDKNYFKRLKDFVKEAGDRGIVVEVTFFSSLYTDDGWNASPLHSKNNINGLPPLAREHVHTLDNGVLLVHQEKMVRKIVRELRKFDNVFFEIQNEPWTDHPVSDGIVVQTDTAAPTWHNRADIASADAMAWQERIASFIVSEEAKLKPSKRHLIAQNVANFRHKIQEPNPAVSIFNFHYALPEAVTLNYGLNKVIGFDESGFAGPWNVTYRQHAWRFILAGGGLFNNLDYSFSPTHEDGTGTPSAPGGGSAALREQLSVLKSFITSFNFLALRPDDRIIKEIKNGKAFALVARDQTEYALYIEGGPQTELLLELRPGTYEAEWINTLHGNTAKAETFRHAGGTKLLLSPDYATDTGLRIMRIAE